MQIIFFMIFKEYLTWSLPQLVHTAPNFIYFTGMLKNHSNIPNMHVCPQILFPFQRPQPTIYTLYRTVLYLIFPKHEILSIYLVLAN